MARDKKATILEAFRNGSTVAEAARAAGIGSKTIYRWAAADPEFGAAVEEARDMADDAVEAVTHRNTLDPDPAHNTLRMFWLKSRRREVYGEKITQEITGKDGSPFPIQVYIPSNGRDINPGHPAE